MAKRFDALLRPHVHGLYRTAYRYTGRKQDAEDLVQDLLVKLYPRTPHLEQIEDLRPWLARSLYHAFVDGVRKHRRAPPSIELDDAEIASPGDPHDDVLTLRQRAALDAAIANLSPQHRAVVMLHLVEGHSLPELSGILDVQIGTLKSRLHRAKAQLQEALQSMEPDRSEERVGQYEM